MNQVEFESELQREGFDEIGVKELPEAITNNAHGHAFDARALILDGEITLTVDGTATPFREGDVFYVPAACPHQETVPAGGVRYVYGLRHTTS